MAGPHVDSPSDTARLKQLEGALDGIGVTGAHRSIIALILVGCLFDAFEQNSIGIIGPILRQNWGLSATDIGFLNTITFAFGATGRLLTGYLADRLGRRTMLTIDLLLFTLGAIVCALAPNYAVLACGRAIVGFGLGGEISVAVTILAEFCSSKFRGTAVGLINVGAGGIGNFLAPAFGLLVFAIFPGPDRWRWLFAALVLPAILGAFYRRFIPETPRYLVAQGRIAEANKVLSRLASGRLTGPPPPAKTYITADDQPRLGSESPVRLRELVEGKFGRRTIPTAIAIWMTYGAQLSVLTMMPSVLIAQGYTITTSLVFTMVIQSGSLLGAIAASLLGYRFPRKRVLIAGAVLACLAALCFGFLASSVSLILLFGATFQFFVLLLNTTIWIFAPELYPTRIRATGTALILATGTLAGAVMPLVAGKLFDGFGIAGLFGMIAAMYLIFASSIQLVPENLRQVDGRSRASRMTRILLINPNSSGATTDMMVAIAQTAAPGGVVIVGATAQRGPPMIVDAAALDASAAEVVEIGMQRAGEVSGIIVSAFGDPGLAELKRVIAIPATGIAESAMLEAADDGRRFGIATVTPDLVPAIEARVAALGLAALHTGIRLTPGDPMALAADPDRLIEALAEAVAACIWLDQAKAVIIGGGPLGQVAAALATRFAVPIIAPIRQRCGGSWPISGNRRATFAALQ